MNPRYSTSLRQFLLLVASLGLIGKTNTDAAASVLNKKGIRRPSFQAGDNFYQNLRYKRINGKWKVR